MQSSVELLPESDNRTVCVHVSGIITAEDFEKNFVTPVKAITSRNSQINLCVIYSDDSRGWDPAAAEASFKTFSEFGTFADRCAYVNAPDSIHLMLKMMQPLLPNADIRFFESDEADKAMTWAKTGL